MRQAHEIPFRSENHYELQDRYYPICVFTYDKTVSITRSGNSLVIYEGEILIFPPA